MSLRDGNRIATTRLQKVFGLTIILFLGVLSIVSFDYVKSKVRDQKRKADIKQLTTALAIYYEQHQRFPMVEDEDWAGWDASTEPDGNLASFLDVLYEEKIMDVIPTDPLNDRSHHYRYVRYPAGTYGCSQAFFILQITNFENQEKELGAGSCPEQNFVEWAENGYTVQMFE